MKIVSLYVAFLMLASLSACVQTRVIKDNSVDAQINRSMQPGYVHQGGPTDFGNSDTADFSHLPAGAQPAGAQWSTNLQTDPPPAKP